MRKKNAAGALAVLGVVALGIGGTYAAFSSTGQGPDTSVQAGTLDLRLSTGNGASIGPISFENLQPGDQRSYFVRLTNDGTIPGEAYWSFENNQELENTCDPPESAAGDRTCRTEQGELGDQLAVTFSLMSDPACTGTSEPVVPQSFSPSFSRGFTSLDGLVLTANESHCVRVNVEFRDLPGDGNNRAQGDSSSFGFRFMLEQ